MVRVLIGVVSRSIDQVITFPGELLPGMRRLCNLRANMTSLLPSLTLRANPRNQETFYQLDFQVVMSFKRAKIQAKLTWNENVCILAEPSYKFAFNSHCLGETTRRACHYFARLHFLMGRHLSAAGILDKRDGGSNVM
jgi:hypothetical protein